MDNNEIKELMNEDVLAELYETVEVPEGLCGTFVKFQPGAGDEGRKFSVTGPKADKIRKLIFADQLFTRKQISDLVDCSVSRVGEVIWALEEDVKNGVIDSFPKIPLKPESISAKSEESAA